MTFTVTTEDANGAYTHLSMGLIVMVSVLITSLKERVESIPVELPSQLKRFVTTLPVRQLTDEIMGHGASANMLKATVNIGTIHGGVKVNLIPATCVFEADIRLPIGLTRETVLAHIDDLLVVFPQAGYSIQEAVSNPASYSNFNHPFARCIADAAERVTGRTLLPLIGLGGTDCKFYRYNDIPSFVYGPLPVGMGAQEEAVQIAEFLAVIKTHTLAVFHYLWDGQS
jgi:succinyl-diaminopimelate desuccinylase